MPKTVPTKRATGTRSKGREGKKRTSAVHAAAPPPLAKPDGPYAHPTSEPSHEQRPPCREDRRSDPAPAEAPAPAEVPVPRPVLDLVAAIPAPIQNPDPNPGLTPAIGTLVPQAHGGALRYGSLTPGPGRPRALVRLSALDHSPASVEFLRRVRDGDEKIEFITSWGMVIPMKPKMADRLKATEQLNRMAGLFQESDDEGEDKPTLTVRVVYE